MILPIWLLLIPFLGVVGFAGAFLLFNLFDMGVYGVQSSATKAIFYLYIGGFLTILFFAGMNLATIDWGTSLDLGTFLPGTGNNSANFGL
jgi:hypothetical protein